MPRIPPDLRDEVVLQAKNVCEYCRLPQECQAATFPVDHVIPVALDGPTELANLALACQQCNAKKWMHAEAVDSETGERVPLFNPRTQVWEEHFRWADDDAAILEPLTAEARATLELLELNSPRRIEIRHWLMEIGQHPLDPTTRNEELKRKTGKLR